MPETNRAPDRNLPQHVNDVESSHDARELRIMASPRLDDGFGLPFLNRANVSRAREGVDEHGEHQVAANVGAEDDGGNEENLGDRGRWPAVAQMRVATGRIFLETPVQVRPVAHEGDANQRVHRHGDRGEIRAARDGRGGAVDVFVLDDAAEQLLREDGEGEEEDEDDGEDADERRERDAKVRDESCKRLATAEDFHDADESDRPQDRTNAGVDDAAEDETDDRRDGDEEVELVPFGGDVDGEGLSENFAEGFKAEEHREHILKRFEHLAVDVRRRVDLNAEKQKVGDRDHVADEHEPRSADDVAELLLDVAVGGRAIEGSSEVAVDSSNFSEEELPEADIFWKLFLIFFIILQVRGR